MKRAARPLQLAPDNTAPPPARIESQVCRLRHDRKLGPARIWPILRNRLRRRRTESAWLCLWTR